MRLATAAGRRSQEPPDQTSAYRCGRSRLRRLSQPYQPSPRSEFFNGIGQEPEGDDQVRFRPSGDRGRFRHCPKADLMRTAASG